MGRVSVTPPACPYPEAVIVTVTVPPGATDAGSKLRLADCAYVGRMPITATTPNTAAIMTAVKTLLYKALSLINKGFSPPFLDG